MNNLEFNKIFAALLVAGIIAMLGGFIADALVSPEELERDAVPIEVATASAANIQVKPEGPEPILALIATADIARGQKLSKACAACHSFDKGGPNKIGPNLWKIVDAPKAGNSSFKYSSAMAGKGGNWNYADLNAFLWKPKKYIAGTKMGFIGLKKPQDRADLIGWLRTLSDSPSAFPGPADIEAEASQN